MTDSGRKTIKYTMHKDVKNTADDDNEKKRKKSRPDTHDVNNDRSSFDVLLSVYFHGFCCCFFWEAHCERGLRIKRHNTLCVQRLQPTSIQCEWNVICKNCTGDSFGTHSSSLARKKRSAYLNNNKKCNNKVEELESAHTLTKWPFRI